VIESIFDLAARIASIFPQGSTPYLIALLITSSAIMVLLAVVGFTIIEFTFLRSFKLIIGRDFVFTQRMASILSNVLAAVFICAYTFNLLHAIQTGETLTLEHRGGPSSHLIYWKDNHFEFIWNFVASGALLLSLYGTVKTLFFKAAMRPQSSSVLIGK
jgi:hypothetical protein